MSTGDCVSLVMTVLGGGLALWGGLLTLKAWATPTENLLTPLKHLLTRMRHHPPKSARGSANAGLSLSGRAAGFKQYSDLPSIEKPDEFTTELNRRLNELFSSAGQANNAAADLRKDTERERTIIREEVKSAESLMLTAVTGLEEKARREFISGVRFEAVGFLVLVMGAAVQISTAI